MMERIGSLLAAGFLAVLAGAPSWASSGSSSVSFDDQKGRYISFEVGQLQSIVFDDERGLLYVINQLGNRLVVMHPQTMQRIIEIPIGLGGASIARRPGTDELWLVDRVEGCVSVIDLSMGAIKRTIRLGGEPYGIAFSEAGDRAWVTCSAVDRVDVIDAALYQVVKSIPIPAKNPRGITFHAGRVWVSAFLSGNNTAPRGTVSNTSAVNAVKVVEGAGINPLPDRDLFAIVPGATPQGDVLDTGASVRGLGTILFNVHARPGTSQLWIPNTEALNSQHKGEQSFIQGKVVSNRLTIVDAQGAIAPRIIDLDQLAPPGIRCAQPTGLCFDPVRPRVYVCGYGSDIVAVLDILPNQNLQWAGAIQLPPKQTYPRGTAPRACVTNAAGTTLYVHNKNDNSVARINLASLPTQTPFLVSSGLPANMGFAAGSTEERLGRHLFTDARNSKSQTSSCASCHVDGNTDGVAWDLSAFLDAEGTPPDGVGFGLDVKGPLVTQGVRRMEESGPYHWRGEKRHINEFNNSFLTLLEREVNGEPKNLAGDFQYLRHYINRLAIPANPRENRDRSLTAQQENGARVFQVKPVLGSLTCSSCHTLPLGTRGEVVAVMGAAGVVKSGDVPSLRGLQEKLSPAFDVGGAFGTRTELGAGLLHNGSAPTLRSAFYQQGVVDPARHLFALSAVEVTQLEEFLLAFDTGLAPATAFQVTAHPGNFNLVRGTDLLFLKNQAAAGNCDLVYFRTPAVRGLNRFPLTGMYDVRSGRFLQASTALPGLEEGALFAEAAAGYPVTFIGVPLGSGRTRGLDRDCDELFDLDERWLGTNVDFFDSDNDSYPDAYELDLGMDPLVQNASAPDTVAPTLVGAARLIYATTNSLKLEFEISEVGRVHVSYNGGPPLQRLPLDHHSDRTHWVIFNNLEPDTNYTISLEMRDPEGNINTDSTTVFRTLPRVTLTPVAVDAISLSVVPGAVPALHAAVDLKVGTAPAANGYTVRATVLRRTLTGALSVVANNVGGVIVNGGQASFALPLPPPTVPSTLYFVVTDIESPHGLPPYVMAYSREVYDSIGY